MRKPKIRLGRRWALPAWLRPQYTLILPVVGIGVGLALAQRQRWRQLTSPDPDPSGPQEETAAP
jgi:hypothetical protein